MIGAHFEVAKGEVIVIQLWPMKGKSFTQAKVEKRNNRHEEQRREKRHNAIKVANLIIYTKRWNNLNTEPVFISHEEDHTMPIEIYGLLECQNFIRDLIEKW